MIETSSSSDRMQSAWPSAAKCLLYFKIQIFLNLFFIAIYGGANFFASSRAQSFRYYFDWELGIPFIPQFIYVYFSIGLVFLLPLFFVDIRKLRRLAWIFGLCIAIAGLIFLLAPGKIAFPRTPPHTLGIPEAWLYAMLYQLDRPYNTLPSLHVALSTLTILAANQATASRWLGAGLLLWLMFIMLSVLFVHQHHVADILAGALLGWGCYRLYVRRIS